MKRIAGFIVEKRVWILMTVLLLAGVCGLLIPKVEINTDLTKYLPDKSSMKIGMDIMDEEFPDADTDSTIRVMFRGLTDAQKSEMEQKLSEIKYVSDVDYKSADSDYNRGGYTKYVLHTEYDYESAEEHSIEQTLETDFQQNEMKYKNDSNDTPDMPTWVAIAAVLFITLILIIMSGSWIEPFLFLFTIGIAIAVNLGTNVILGSISEKTLSVAAILQLVLSMDYSIILTNRFRQELSTDPDKKSAMKSAIVGAFSSISSSSLTTVVGLLALVFMSFKMGYDMGVVLAKGVFFSVVCVFLVLPGLLLMCSPLLEKTAKRSPEIPMGGLAKLCNHLRIPLTLSFLALFAAAFILQRYTAISYSMTGEDPIADIFPTTSTVVLVYDNQDDEKITAIAEELKTQKNVKSAANYSNTLAKQHTAADMVDAIDDLSENMGSGKKREIEPDESVFNMLYHKYYGGETGKIKAGEFLKFIAEDVMKNDSFRSYISEDMSENTEMIEKLSNAEMLQKPMTAKELAAYFDMEQSDCEQLFLYYYIQNQGAQTETMTVDAFVSFVLKDLASDSAYADMFDADTLSRMKLLQHFTTKEALETGHTPQEIAEIMEIDEDTARMLFVYYFGSQKNYQPKTMTIQELTAFLLEDVASDPNFSGQFDEKAVSQIRQLANYTDRSKITQEMDAAGLAQMLGMDETLIRQIFRLDSSGLDLDNRTMTLRNFTAFLETMAQDPAYIGDFDAETLTKIGSMKTLIDLASSRAPLSAAELSAVLGMDESFITQLFMGYSMQTGQEITAMPLTDFVGFLVNAILPNPDYASYFDESAAMQLGMMQQICNAAADDTGFSIGELAALFGMDESRIRLIFTLYYGSDDKHMSLYDFAAYLSTDVLENPIFSGSIDSASAEQIGTLSRIMDLAVQRTALDPRISASLFGLDTDTMKLLFTLKDSKTAAWKLTLKDLVGFLNDHAKALSGLADADMLDQIGVLKTISDAALAEEQLDGKRLSELMSMEEETAQKLFLLYTYKRGKTDSWRLSAEQFMRFLAEDVLADREMSKQIPADQHNSLTSAAKIVQAVVSGKTYTSDEMAKLFAGMSDEMDDGTMALLYLYHDSNTDPDSTRTMSVEQLMNYLNDTLIYDETFRSALDEEMIADIKQNAADLNDGIKQLKGAHYSRLILSVTVPEEGPETDAFYEDVNARCADLKGDYHLIGSSAMNYEMSQSFGDELLLITLLTALSIFLVVLITFRSLAVPVILVLLVQCGVYVTVTVIGFQGYSIYYMALMIVQCILMGSTIDYGILFSNYYREARRTCKRTEALRSAYDGSMHTIFTSGLIIVSATAILGQCFGEPTVEQICQTISIGAASAIIMIIFILPGVLACLDRWTAGRHRLK